MDIIVIDDSLDDFELYARLLKKIYGQDVSLTHFLSSESALRALKIKDINYDLILLDYHLPGDDGLSFLKKMHQDNVDIIAPIIILTGQGDEATAVDFMKLNAEHYLDKNKLTQDILKKAIDDAQNVFEKKKRDKEIQEERRAFAYTLAHDLQNPVKRMQSYCALAKKNPQKCEKYLNYIEEDSAFVIDFIKQLLIYAESGRSSAAKEMVCMKEIIQKSLDHLSVPIQEKSALIKLEGDFPKVYGARIPLVQLFQNIIGNGIKYCKEKPCVEVSSKINGDVATISVKDNGIGIPKEVAKHIFQPFFRVSFDDNMGHGLGLSIVKTIAQQHNATIDVTHPKGGGSQFNVNFSVQVP